MSLFYQKFFISLFDSTIALTKSTIHHTFSLCVKLCHFYQKNHQNFFQKQKYPLHLLKLTGVPPVVGRGNLPRRYLICSNATITYLNLLTQKKLQKNMLFIYLKINLYQAHFKYHPHKKHYTPHIFTLREFVSLLPKNLQKIFLLPKHNRLARPV